MSDAIKATAAALAAGRVAEDADGPVQDAMADRDATDSDRDNTAQDATRAAPNGPRTSLGDGVVKPPCSRIEGARSRDFAFSSAG